MKRPIRPTRRWRAFAAQAVLACLVFVPLPAAVKTKPVAEVLDAGAYKLQWLPARDWQAKVHRESDCVIFQYKDEPGESVAATIGIFRLVVPSQARSADKAQLGAAYVTQDVAGAQQALFQANAHLALWGKTPEAMRGGQLFRYAEPIDVNYNRERSTKFFRAWLFFPAGFAQSGVIYLVVGREQSVDMETAPSVLELARELLAGIHD